MTIYGFPYILNKEISLKMILTERHIILKSNPLYKELDKLCFLSKNLYNSAMYAVRQYYFENKKYLSWISVANMFTKNKQTDYYALPCKVSQQTIKMVDQSMKSFFAGMKSKKCKARLPKYLNKEKGRFMVIYTNQAISHKELKNGYIALSKTNVRVKTKVACVQQVRVVPKKNIIVIEVLYKVDCKHTQHDKRRYCGVDFGLNNLMTCAFADERPLIFNGKPLKSINWYYNKNKAKLQNRLKNSLTSNRIGTLTVKRNNKVSDFIHKTSRMFVNYLVSNGITDVVIGYNKGWKQGINLGKVTNQNFVSIPHCKLLYMISYKCELEGITVHVTEESYTSKCSFLDDEEVCKHETYQGKRIKRGMFRSSDGTAINADVNGALNILKKVIGKYDYDPIKVCSTPMVLRP